MNRTAIGLLVLGGALALAGFLALIRTTETSGDVALVEAALTESTTSVVLRTPADPTAITTTTTSPPIELTEPPQQEAVAAITVPVGLRIDALGVNAPVGSYGVDRSSGEMAVPDNTTEVGWYKFGAKPGERGSAVLAAHVDLAGSGPGVFFDLRTLKEGDRVSVLHEDGTETGYRVVATTTYTKDELPLDVVFSTTGPPVLTLITCGGGFNPSISRYDSNVVVYAVPTTDAELPEGSSL